MDNLWLIIVVHSWLNMNLLSSNVKIPLNTIIRYMIIYLEICSVIKVLDRIPERQGPLGDTAESDMMKKIRLSFTVVRLIRLSRAPFTKEELLDINAKLNVIPKVK